MSVGWNPDDPATVLVTGCSSGIGLALCGALHARGHRVIATSRKSTDRLAAVPASRHLELDVTDDASVAAAAAAAGPIDVLVNNAGVTAWAPLEQLPIETARRVFETNVWGALRMCQAFLPSMRAAGRGRVVNVSSAALRGYPLLGLYAASKTALETLSESMRLELALFGIDVVLAEPAGVVSSFGRNRIPVTVADPAYRDLTERSYRYLQSLRGTTLAAEEAATVIAGLVELDDPPLRVPVGAEARRITAERHTVSDRDFEESVRSRLCVAPQE